MKADETKRVPGDETELLPEAVRRYLPVLYFDKKEPFFPIAVGYTLFRERGISRSTGRTIDPARRNAALCMEYAYYYDYDIQHLYDLEHIWIYTDGQGAVCGCECSFHGMYLNAMLPGMDLTKGTDRVHMYVQPGKHAFLPDPRLFPLFLDYDLCCGSLAGKDGILTPSVIPGMPAHSGREDEKMVSYIQKKYAFVPSEEYEEYTGEFPLMTWEEAASIIPERLKKEMKHLFEK